VLVEIEQDGFGSGPIKVVSEDGKKWTKILDGDLTLPVRIRLGITSGYTAAYEIKQGATSLAFRIVSGSGWSGETTLTVTGSTKNFAIEALTILNACNAKRNVGNGIHQKHTFWHGVELELIGYFDMTNHKPYPPYSGSGTVQVPVECLPYQGASGDVTVSGGDHGDGPMIIKDAKLFLTTYSGQNTGVTMGGCKALKTTVRFETNRAGPVNFDLNRFPGGVTSHTVDAAFDAGAGKYYARYEKSESFKSTTNLQYMAQSTAPLGGNTGWKDITIHCGGDLAPDTGSADPHDGLPNTPQLKGDFSFLADNTTCPRKVKALINFSSSVKDNVHYSLDCTNGHFSGVAQTAEKPGGGYVAPALVTFDVPETTQANCVLKSVAPGRPKVHTLKGHKYQCVKRDVDPASGDLTDTPKPKPKDRKDKATDDAKTKAKTDRDAKAKLKLERDAAAKLKEAAQAERRRKAAEKAAADRAKKDLAKKLKLLKANKTGTASKDKSAAGESSTLRVR
jgi:hypothetical protein